MLHKRLVDLIAQAIGRLESGHPIRIAIDGIDAAGKTTLADEIAAALEHDNKHVIRASIDGFHRPKKDRYFRGGLSPEGYYYDSFDNEAIRDYLLHPLGPGGTGEYRTTVFDFRNDSPLLSPLMRAPTEAVLLFDGVFLLRPELNDHWDVRIFLHIDFDVSLQRALCRDLALFGTKERITERYEQRYVRGQKIYLHDVEPQKIADIVIDNNDPLDPILIRNSVKL
ncbi:MAG: uridine kinase [candidate division WOR-3 bacterium]|nr:uridine kinase [candidate division WOR-3 bacterium]